MNPKLLKKKSKFISLVLRHQPEVIGLELDAEGWALVEDLLDRVNRPPHSLSFEELKWIVENNDKKRFIFSPDLKRIRANQGHSMDVDLNLEEQIPPGLLYHGTAIKNIESIKTQGLIKWQRQHVHLSLDKETAKAVGGRHGKPVVLIIESMNMYQSGISFYRSENGVWLVDSVPSHFIQFPD